MRLWPWLLPVSIAAAITVLSHSPSYPMGIALPPPLDKLAHLAAYAALSASLELAWTRTVRSVPLYRRHIVLFLATCLFGALDEWHQSFVPGRDTSIWDWAADSIGAAFGLAAASLLVLRGRWLDAVSWVKGQARRPDSARPLILVADPHWTGELTGLERATAAHPEADWLFLGDVFDVWIAGLESPAQRSLLAWVDDRRQAGRWVGLWSGNRDFFLDRHASRFDYVGEGLGGGLPEESLAFEHGDLVNGADLAYRVWNLLSRSAPAWLFVRLLPAATGQALARALEQKLRTTNRNYRVAFPERAFAAVAAEHPGETFLTGHFHTRHEVGNGIALPWAHEGAFMVWRQGKIAEL